MKIFNKNSKYKIGAVLLMLLHIPVVFVIIFGYLFTGIYSYLYFALLLTTLFSWVFLGYCPLTKWEFDLKSKYTEMPKYHFEYLHYWGYRYLHIDIDVKRIRLFGTVFLVVSIIAFILIHTK